MDKIIFIIAILSGISTFFSFIVFIGESGEINEDLSSRTRVPGIILMISGIIFVGSLVYLN